MKRLFTFVVLVCFGLGLLAAEGFSAERWQKPKKRQITSQPAAPEEAAASRRISRKYPAEGIGYDLTCGDINPQAGTIVEHDQIGSTWYDLQQNASMTRMISVTGDGYRHFSWMSGLGDYPEPRYIDANCKDPAGSYVGPVHADGGSTRAGYSNQTHLHDGESVIVYHRVDWSPNWHTSLTIDDSLCGGLFTRHWDVPDKFDSWAEGLWPRAEVLYDEMEDRDYVHIVMREFNYKAPNAPQRLGYVRCFLDIGDTLVCEAYYGGAQSYRVPEGQLCSEDYIIGLFDTTCSVNATMAVSPVSHRVAVAYLRPAWRDDCYGYLSDVCYIESMNNGDDWVDGSSWPPSIHNLTNFGTVGNERANADVNVCYDFDDSLHLVYVTAGFDSQEPGSYQPGIGRLYHWSKRSGVVMIANAIWEQTFPGYYYGANIGKMSISAPDPIHHPGGDSVYLFCIWTQFDTADNAAGGWTNGELYGCGSFDGGQTWGQPWNLTNTQTPGCAPGECLSEHWSSLAQNMYDGDLHIQYICDRDAGGAIMDQGTWTENPVMYLRLSPWDVSLAPRGLYMIVPPNWSQPPLKVTRGGTRELLLTVRNIGNMELNYDASGDHDCILGYHSGSLTPGDAVTLSFSIQGSGACDDTLIDGNIVLTTNESGQHIETFPVLAVVADDYYECPKDAETVDTLDNGVLRLYTNANCMEWIHDVGTFPDTTHEVFFTGGTILATTSDGDTLVGRYMGQNDQHSGARDKLYREECDVDWEPEFSILYTKNIFMHDLDPPASYKWYWWEMSKQVKFFKETAPEVYKHLVIKYVTVKRHDPPSWWPDHDPFTDYEDAYIGVAEDIDCPADTFEFLHASNSAGYDDVNDIAWQRGWDYTGAHPEYNDYYCGIALADAGMSGESIVPYGSYNIRNEVYLHPQGGWGWKDGELYQLASASGNAIQDSDAIVDRSWVFTARKIDAGSDADYEARFTVVLAVAPGGLSQLQEYVDSARAIVARERTEGGLPAQCGDCNGDFVVNIGDVVLLVGYLFKSSTPPKCPVNRGDCNSDGIINVGDIVYLIGYLYRGGPTPVCPGIWY